MFSAFSLAQCNQIGRVKLQLRMQMKWLDMMNLHVLCTTTGYTGWLALKMLFFDTMPLGATGTPVLSGYVRSMIHPLLNFALDAKPSDGMGHPACTTSAPAHITPERKPHNNRNNYQ